MTEDVRVVNADDNSWALVIGPVVVGYDKKPEQEELAEVVQSWLERRLLGAYCRYSVELRERLRWRTGVGAAETMEQVARLAHDLDEVRMDAIEAQVKIETLESELVSLWGMFNVQVQELDKVLKEFLATRDRITQYRWVLRGIANASSDMASRLAAEGILYTGEP